MATGQGLGPPDATTSLSGLPASPLAVASSVDDRGTSPPFAAQHASAAPPLEPTAPPDASAAPPLEQTVFLHWKRNLKSFSLVPPPNGGGGPILSPLAFTVRCEQRAGKTEWSEQSEAKFLRYVALFEGAPCTWPHFRTVSAAERPAALARPTDWDLARRAAVAADAGSNPTRQPAHLKALRDRKDLGWAGAVPVASLKTHGFHLFKAGVDDAILATLDEAHLKSINIKATVGLILTHGAQVTDAQSHSHYFYSRAQFERRVAEELALDERPKKSAAQKEATAREYVESVGSVLEGPNGTWGDALRALQERLAQLSGHPLPADEADWPTVEALATSNRAESAPQQVRC